VETRTTPVVAPGAYPIESPIDGNAATIEGAAQALLAMQLKQMQATEAAKAYDAWDRLQPKMDEARSKGRWVRVGLHLDVPEKIDVIGGVVGIGDISQIVWFRTMWIEVMETREQAYGTTKRGDPEPIRCTMGAADPHQQPDDVPHPHTRIVATQLVLPPYPAGEKHGRTVLRQKPGFVGTYRPIAFRDVSGNEAAVKAFGMQRKLTIGDRGRDDIGMLDASDSQPLWPSSTWVDTHARTQRYVLQTDRGAPNAVHLQEQVHLHTRRARYAPRVRAGRGHGPKLESQLKVVGHDLLGEAMTLAVGPADPPATTQLSVNFARARPRP
jgi:hypothetical protein